MPASDPAPTAVITGGNRGLGESLTLAFAEAGYRVVIGARTKTAVCEGNPNVRFQPTDVRREGDHAALAKAALDWTGRLDVYLNCAGYSKWSPIQKVDESFWDDMIDTNLKGTFWGCKVASQNLKFGGTIINMNSLAGRRGTSNNSVYCASKFGVTGITQALAKELGPKGIRVNAVCPVLIRTSGLEQALAEEDAPAGGPDKIDGFLKNFTQQQTALGRLPTGREVAAMCLFLASPAASAITGQSIHVDCGVLPL